MSAARAEAYVEIDPMGELESSRILPAEGDRCPANRRIRIIEWANHTNVPDFEQYIFPDRLGRSKDGIRRSMFATNLATCASDPTKREREATLEHPRDRLHRYVGGTTCPQPIDLAIDKQGKSVETSERRG